MALTNEDLKAISDMMDKKLPPINDRLDKMDNRLDKMDNRLNTMEVKQNRMSEQLTGLQLSQN